MSWTSWNYKLWKILKEMRKTDHLTCLLRNLRAGQEAIVRTGHGTTDWFQIGKGVRQGCILSPCLFNLYAEYIKRNAGLAAITICSDFEAPKNKVWQFPLFLHLFAMKWWDQMPWYSFSECWILSQLFHSPFSLSSRGSLVLLHFLP